MSASTVAAPASRRRGFAGWVIVVVAFVLVGGIGAAVSGLGQWSDRGALDPDGAGRDGTRALAQILREQGVTVEVARSRVDALAALGDGEGRTLVLPDSPYLSDDALADLADTAEDVVVVDPRTRAVELLLPGSTSYGYGGAEAVAPACDLAEAERSGAVAVGRTFLPGDGVTGCYPVGDAFGLLWADQGAHRVSMVDAAGVFTNDALADDGNAALALNLMGRNADLVWYVPSPGDTDLAGPPPTLGDLTPGWVTPAIVLLAVAAVAAGIWRGRRFGPLVVERLPVSVRAGETMEGRGRLYARARDHLHAADALRIGATRRLAKALGLGPSATVHEVADAAADRIGASRATVRGLLVDELPRTDADLMSISDRLRNLERAVRAAVRDEGRDG